MMLIFRIPRSTPDMNVQCSPALSASCYGTKPAPSAKGIAYHRGWGSGDRVGLRSPSPSPLLTGKIRGGGKKGDNGGHYTNSQQLYLLGGRCFGCRLKPWSATRDLAAKQILQAGHKLRRSQRAPGGFGAA